MVTCTLAFNCTEKVERNQREKTGFAALNYEEMDFERAEALFEEVDWDLLHSLCSEGCGSDFLEMLRFTVLQIATITAPSKRAGRKWRDRKLRHLRSRRRKLNRRLVSASGPQKQRLEEEVARVTMDIKVRVDRFRIGQDLFRL